jgi:hypothetical protein
VRTASRKSWPAEALHEPLATMSAALAAVKIVFIGFLPLAESLV